MQTIVISTTQMKKQQIKTGHCCTVVLLLYYIIHSLLLSTVVSLSVVSLSLGRMVGLEVTEVTERSVVVLEGSIRGTGIQTQTHTLNYLVVFYLSC